MDRRELLKMIAVITGGAVVGGEIFLTGCNAGNAGTPDVFSTDDIAFLDEVAETILPKTKLPGAKDAGVGEFMTVMVNDCYTPEQQKVFHEGIKLLEEACKKMYGQGFMHITPAQRHDLLLVLDKEGRQYQAKKRASDKKQDEKKKQETMSPHYFVLMKQLTLLGYFTSKVGATEALRFVAVPGRFDACIPYKKGDRAWA